MPQNPQGVAYAKGPNGLAPLVADAAGLLLTTPGGSLSALNLTAGAHLVKASAGRIAKLVVNTVGSAGTLSVNDSATAAGAAASNLVWAGVDTTAAGTVIVLDWPCANGIVVTVPTGGVVAVSFS